MRSLKSSGNRFAISDRPQKTSKFSNIVGEKIDIFFFLTINNIQEVFARLLAGIMRLNWRRNGWSGPKTGSYAETTWSRHAKAFLKSEID
jgi:hypothetical protein